ncbi:hypothetical protein BC939DRAFT_514726 [Gamsiella multidivaricata]|uniref:uncharacterized protein n=1 Tax=Gamsiella multidivaricata TaxID=101098 RepID=UPI00221EE5D5|nr:uncharacterized protein BC939DRAFT_514726 [Gamsiella multidivaricata]KAI7825974.1 hypothetical protein BC939DRAFT_514726 [Gamsiella multidivaricata]
MAPPPLCGMLVTMEDSFTLLDDLSNLLSRVSSACPSSHLNCSPIVANEASKVPRHCIDRVLMAPCGRQGKTTIDNDEDIPIRDRALHTKAPRAVLTRVEYGIDLETIVYDEKRTVAQSQKKELQHSYENEEEGDAEKDSRAFTGTCGKDSSLPDGDSSSATSSPSVGHDSPSRRAQTFVLEKKRSFGLIAPAISTSRPTLRHSGSSTSRRYGRWTV